jgi:hypothetical protein
MNLRKFMILMITLSTFVTSAAIYTHAIYNKNQRDFEKIAIDFLVNNPTFSFDGLIESITVMETYSIENDPTQYVVVLAFNTSHAGWGDREGTFIAQIITPHVIKITIVEEEVTEAIIDDVWDEINQTQLHPKELLVVEDARDKAIFYILEKYPELELEYPENWITETTTPSGLVGSSTIRYMGEGWNITLHYLVIQFPDFDVNVQYSGKQGFKWCGTVYNTGLISETSMTK